MKPRGRHFVIGWTGVFLVVAGIVVLRLVKSYAAADRLGDMHQSIDSLLAEQAEQLNALGPLQGEALRIRAQALGLQDAPDSTLVVLTLPPAP